MSQCNLSWRRKLCTRYHLIRNCYRHQQCCRADCFCSSSVALPHTFTSAMQIGTLCNFNQSVTHPPKEHILLLSQVVLWASHIFSCMHYTYAFSCAHVLHFISMCTFLKIATRETITWIVQYQGLLYFILLLLWSWEWMKHIAGVVIQPFVNHELYQHWSWSNHITNNQRIVTIGNIGKICGDYLCYFLHSIKFLFEPATSSFLERVWASDFVSSPAWSIVCA